MKILYLADAASLHTKKLVEYFVNAGHEVHIITFNYSKISNAKVYALKTFGFGKLGYFLGVIPIIKIAKSINPDIIHAHYITSYGFLAALANLRPLVITAWGSDLLIAPKKSWIRRKFAIFAAKKSNLFTVVANHMLKPALDLGIEPLKVIHTPLGINVDFFHLNQSQKLDSKIIRIISTRSLRPLYDHRTLILAMVILKKKGYQFLLEIAGDGPLFDFLKKLTIQHDLEDNVKFLGFLGQDDLVSKLGGSDVYISSAISDGDSASLLEAMACGAFPIATSVPANSYWIKDSINGLLFAPGDSQMLAKCLEEIISGKYDLKKISINNRKMMVDMANNKNCYKFISSLYSGLILKIRHINPT